MSYKQIDEQLEKFWDDFEDVLFCECLDSQKVGAWGFKPERLVELKKIIHQIYDQAKAEQREEDRELVINWCKTMNRQANVGLETKRHTILDDLIGFLNTQEDITTAIRQEGE